MTKGDFSTYITKKYPSTSSFISGLSLFFVDAIVLMVNRKKVNSAVEDNIKESPNTGGIHVVVALVLLGISLATIFVTMSFGRKIEKI